MRGSVSQPTKKKLKIQEEMIERDGVFISSKKYEYFYINSKNIKFIVDTMLFKLVKFLRNVGIDTAYLAHTDANLLIDLALN